MKKRFFLYFVVIAFLGACSGDDPLPPSAEACFDYSPHSDITVGEEISFTNCSENATSYAWDFGDGTVSTAEDPSHTYDEAGSYIVKLVSANTSGIDTVSATIVVGDANFFSINDARYDLTSAVLIHNAGKWHSLFLVDDRMSTSLMGAGNIVCLDVLAGKGKFDITGAYTLSGKEFNGEEADISAMTGNTVYNGFCSLAYDYSFENESPAANDLVWEGDENYNNFDMSIEETDGIYLITITVDINGKHIKVFYKGELTFQSSNN